VSPERLVHHELCFGCGRTNLFGLLMEVEMVGERHVRGRAFVKQDHQGAARGSAHEGVITAALSDAMALACGPEMRPVRVELELEAAVPVGSFLEVEARADDGGVASATAQAEDRVLARANGVYRRRLPASAGSV
jgi:acyl-coenzyme A thioesterase PaaI-like protein